MTEKEETATAVLDEEIVKEILEGEPVPEDGESRLVRLERPDEKAGADPDEQADPGD